MLIIFPQRTRAHRWGSSDLFDWLDKKGHARPGNLGWNLQIFECMPKSGRRKIYRVCTTLVNLVSQPLLESRKYFLSSILWELLSVERVSGYPKARQHFWRKMNDNSLKFSRRRCWMVVPLDDSRWNFASMWKLWLGPLFRIWGAVGYAPLLVMK